MGAEPARGRAGIWDAHHSCPQELVFSVVAVQAVGEKNLITINTRVQLQRMIFFSATISYVNLEEITKT